MKGSKNSVWKDLSFNGAGLIGYVIEKYINLGHCLKQFYSRWIIDVNAKDKQNKKTKQTRGMISSRSWVRHRLPKHATKITIYFTYFLITFGFISTISIICSISLNCSTFLFLSFLKYLD